MDLAFDKPSKQGYIGATNQGVDTTRQRLMDSIGEKGMELISRADPGWLEANMIKGLNVPTGSE